MVQVGADVELGHEDADLRRVAPASRPEASFRPRQAIIRCPERLTLDLAPPPAPSRTRPRPAPVRARHPPRTSRPAPSPHLSPGTLPRAPSLGRPILVHFSH